MTKVLIIDDDKVIIKRVEEILLSEKFEVISANDGLSGLNLARSEKPDIIICDLLLPKLNGHQVVRMLKFDARFKEIPIIMFTSNVGEKDREMGKQAGADAYLLKKFSPHHLLKILNSLLERKDKKA